MLHAIKKLQAVYNEDANKLIKQVAQEKFAKQNLIILIAFATIAMVTEDKISTKDEPQTFNEAWNHANPE